jgi:hypothetical protein
LHPARLAAGWFGGVSRDAIYTAIRIARQVTVARDQYVDNTGWFATAAYTWRQVARDHAETGFKIRSSGRGLFASAMDI